MRIVQVSDLHLSPTHGFFVSNWRRTLTRIAALAPDLVIITGDLAINGPEENAELAFARAEIERLGPPWRVLPGNHDIGDEPPGQDPSQIIDGPRLQRWRRWFADDWWIAESPEWRLVGLNAQLFGSGLADEARQDEWLEAVLSAPEARDIAIFLHKPLFVESIADAASPDCVTPAPRRRLLNRFARAPVRMVACGHMHCYRHARHGALDLLWAPATSFLPDADDRLGRLRGAVDDPAPARTVLGVVLHAFTARGWSHHCVTMPELPHRTLAEIKQGRPVRLREMPPFAPEEFVATGGAA
jgi:3',5'-cyclic AMP phosphodiesterase CpdA